MVCWVCRRVESKGACLEKTVSVKLETNRNMTYKDSEVRKITTQKAKKAIPITRVIALKGTSRFGYWEGEKKNRK